MPCSSTRANQTQTASRQQQRVQAAHQINAFQFFRSSNLKLLRNTNVFRLRLHQASRLLKRSHGFFIPLQHTHPGSDSG